MRGVKGVERKCMREEDFFLMPFKADGELLNLCYKTCVNVHNTCIIPESPYLCIVFFIVLDLRLTKVGVQRNSFFYAFI